MLRLAAGLVAAVTLLAPAAVVAPAWADTTRKTDPRGDAPARFDISAVSYRNGPRDVGSSVKVPHLRMAGNFNLSVVPSPQVAGPVLAYIIDVWVGGDGRVNHRFYGLGEDGVEFERECSGFVAHWRLRQQTVQIVVPHSCMRDFDNSHLDLKARFGPRPYVTKDYAPGVRRLQQS